MPRTTASMILRMLILLVAPALGADRTVAKLTLSGAKPVEIWLTRADAEDGGLVLKLIAKGIGPRPQALTLYTGGGDDDGPGTGELKNLSAKVLDVPSAGKLVRVDFGYQIPGTTEEETQTTVVGFGPLSPSPAPKAHKLLELVTKKTHARNKNCREVWETALSGEGDELDGELVAVKKLKVIPVRGDDDEPLDQTCVPQKPQRTVYRWNGDRFLEPKAGAQPSPSPAPAAPQESVED